MTNQSANYTAEGGYLKRLKNRLSKTRQTLTAGFDKIFAGQNRIDDVMLENLEELLITADIGVQTAMQLIEQISSLNLSDVDQVKSQLREEILSILNVQTSTARIITSTPHVIMVVGVNGVGKTTTIGKLADNATASGRRY